jgi:ubiquinone biosynthesis UbiH/UbiF/VisC/COQ6 family hydroxylase
VRHADTTTADVVIVGAGPAGLALAIALAEAGLDTRVLKQAPLSNLVDPPEDGRDIALTHRARAILERLGLWQSLPADEVAPLCRAQVTDGHSPWALPFDARRDGHVALGWLVPNHRIRAACYARACAESEVHLLGKCRAVGFGRDADSAWVDALGPGDAATRHRARLVVAAVSRFSGLRRMAGIGAGILDFGRTAIVCRMAHALDHQGVAHECFRYGHTLAMLPMAGRQSSAVLTVRSDEAPDWLALPDEAFAQRVAEQFEHRLGVMHAAGRRHAYPLVATYAHRFADPRLALVGDAGMLRRWADEHRRTTLPIYLCTNAIVRLSTDDRAPARLARSAVLRLASGLSPLKAAITRQLTVRPAVPGAPLG